jgi:hypothetical protein
LVPHYLSRVDGRDGDDGPDPVEQRHTELKLGFAPGVAAV